MQFHTFFLVAQYRRAGIVGFFTRRRVSLALTKKISTRIISHIHHMCLCVCLFLWSRFECNHFPHSAIMSAPHHEELIADNYSSKNEFAFAIYFSLRLPNRLWLLKHCVPVSSHLALTKRQQTVRVCLCVCVFAREKSESCGDIISCYFIAAINFIDLYYDHYGDTSISDLVIIKFNTV